MLRATHTSLPRLRAFGRRALGILALASACAAALCVYANLGGASGAPLEAATTLGEPGTAVLLLLGLAGLAVSGRPRRRSQTPPLRRLPLDVPIAR